MTKKSNKGLIAAGIALGLVACILIGVLIGIFVLKGGTSSSEELVTDAFCVLNKSSGEDYYYRIPKLNVNKPWADEINEKMYTTLYDEYEKGTVLFDGSNPAAAEMGYEWTEKDDIVSIVVQIKSNKTDGYEFYTFNIDTEQEREITDEELISVFGYEKTEYFEKIRESVQNIYNSETGELNYSDEAYEMLLNDSQSDTTLENALSFIATDGKLNVITPVFSGTEMDNVLAIVDIETGEKKDYFEFKGPYTEIMPDADMAANDKAEGTINSRLEITDADIEELKSTFCMTNDLIEFDCETDSVGYFVARILTRINGAPGYLRYFDFYTVSGADFIGRDNYFAETDPRGIFAGTHMKMPEENVKWICENIYHLEYKSDFESDTVGYSGDIDAYSHNGYVYRRMMLTGGGGAVSMELAAKNRLPDGRYELLFNGMSSLQQTEIFWYYVVDIQKIDGNRYMTHYLSRELSESEFYSRVVATNEPDTTVADEETTTEVIEETTAEITTEAAIETTTEIATEIASYDTASVPTDTDYQYLCAIAEEGMADFNSNTANTSYVVDNYIASGYMIGDYRFYFDEYEFLGAYAGVPETDPRGSFESFCVKLPSENVKWMCENVYNVKFDENYVSDNSYCEDGYVYAYQHPGTSLMENRVKSAEKLYDGRYNIVLESGWVYDNPDVIDVQSEVYIIAGIEETDGIRHWSFYDVKTKELY